MVVVVVGAGWGVVRTGNLKSFVCQLTLGTLFLGLAISTLGLMGTLFLAWVPFYIEIFFFLIEMTTIQQTDICLQASGV